MVGYYSLKTNISYVGLFFSNPRRCISEFARNPSIWFGVVMFAAYMLVCEYGWLSAYASGYQQAISPMPKILPIPDDQYLLYQAIFGPFLKAACFPLFAGSLWVLARLLNLRSLTISPVMSFFAFTGSVMGLIAFAVDQIIVLSVVQGWMRFALSCIHPIALTIDMVYVTAYVARSYSTPLWRALVVVIPSMIIAGPVPGFLFR